MDKRVYVAAFVVIILLLFLGRNRILDIITRSSGFEIVDGGSDVVRLPVVTISPLPGYKPGPSTWTQTTGLMCDCESGAYTAPVVVREIAIPAAPQPRYIYQPQAVQQRASQPPQMMTYSTFGMDSNYPIWGDRPRQTVLRASDGRIFLQKENDIWGNRSIPQKSWSNNFIGTDEYEMRNGVIYYGPYQYSPQNRFMNLG